MGTSILSRAPSGSPTTSTAPSWQIRSAFGAVLANLAEARPELLDWNRGFIESPDWRTRYVAVDFAHKTRHLDASITFELAARRGAADPHCWVRGVTSGCLSAHLLDLHADGRSRLWEPFLHELQRFLRDDDYWVLHEMYDLLQGLRAAGADVSELLKGEVPWVDLNQRQLYERMRGNKRISLSRPGTETRPAPSLS